MPVDEALAFVCGLLGRPPRPRRCPGYGRPRPTHISRRAPACDLGAHAPHEVVQRKTPTRNQQHKCDRCINSTYKIKAKRQGRRRKAKFIPRMGKERCSREVCKRGALPLSWGINVKCMKLGPNGRRGSALLPMSHVSKLMGRPRLRRRIAPRGVLKFGC